MVQLTFNTFIAILSVAAVTNASPFSNPSKAKLRVLAREALPFPSPKASMMVRAVTDNGNNAVNPNNPNNGNNGNTGSNGNSGGGGSKSLAERLLWGPR